MLRVVVVGSGPAGAYAVEALTRVGDVAVDVLDRLPTPFGLVRYGVAPDHPVTQSISKALTKVLEHPDVRFLGNVEVGKDLTLAEMHEHYDAVVFATGAAVDRRMDIPGEDLPGSFSATEFVAWYTGHPSSSVGRFLLDARCAAVVGMGNVAGDVARMLASSYDELRVTDVPDHVLETFRGSSIEDVHILGRRGPAQSKFTTKELRELGQMADADVLVDPADLALSDADRAAIATDARARRNVEVLRLWAERPPAGRSRRIHVRFFIRPVAVLGDSQVTGLQLERTRLDDAGVLTATGETSTLDTQMVLRSVGYRGLPVPGLPFDERGGVIPNEGGRVVRDGVAVPGDYVAGWMKRGPTGVIGTNKHDARESIRCLLEDAPSLPPAPQRDPDALLRLLTDRGVDVVTWQGWGHIERAEMERGKAQGRDRAKINELATLLGVARAEPARDPGEQEPSR